MTLGRPLMLYKFQKIPLPKAVDDEFLNNPVSQPNNHISWVHFYVQSIKLYGILADVVSQVYGVSNCTPGITGNESGFDMVLSIDSTISKLETSTPDHIHWTRRQSLPPHTKVSVVFEQQTSVLHARYLHLRALLYRPIFIRYCQHMCSQESNKDSDPVPDTDFTKVSIAIVRSLSIACVDNSIGLINRLHQYSITSSTGAWWYNVFYARTAGIVVLLAMACATLVDAVGWGNLTSTWSKCQEVLSYLQKFSPTVVPCLRGLKKLHQHVLKFQGRADQHGDTNGGYAASSTTALQGGFMSPEQDVGPDFILMAPEDLFMGSEDFGWPVGSNVALFDEIFNLDSGHITNTSATGGNSA
ncbi:hypothetical protein H2198_004262 [Neophaeococcomyces mojaviensis]|uniref:Uncharacterized protein n=1 Tax=Neophaeococcomyces mojaviensis TaxID=3383035 RepID=A0ACC3A902_9EURO|nr:hypothetical protein H2198_004262 [Knufia sp. JES_112]